MPPRQFQCSSNTCRLDSSSVVVMHALVQVIGSSTRYIKFCVTFSLQLEWIAIDSFVFRLKGFQFYSKSLELSNVYDLNSDQRLWISGPGPLIITVVRHFPGCSCTTGQKSLTTRLSTVGGCLPQLTPSVVSCDTSVHSQYWCLCRLSLVGMVFFMARYLLSLAPSLYVVAREFQ